MAHIPTHQGNNNIFKAPTGSTGPTGDPIFDVFEGSRKIELPEFKERGLNIELLNVGEAPTDFESEFKPAEPRAITTTDGIRQDLIKSGITTEDVPEFEKDTGFEDFISDIRGKFKRSDEIVKNLVSLQGPTIEEQTIASDIEELENMLREDIQKVQERGLEGGLLRSGIANEINDIVQGDTRKSLVLLRRMDNLNRKLTRLQGDRKAQAEALALEYDIRRQSISDAIDFFQLTSPQNIQVNTETGQAIFRNPITQEVFSVPIEGFEAGTTKQDTTITTKFGRKTLIDKQTGETIADLGPADDNDFTRGQKNAFTFDEVATQASKDLEASRGNDGFFDPDVFLQFRNEVKNNNPTFIDDFDKKFANDLNPIDAQRLGITQDDLDPFERILNEAIQ